MLNNVNPIPSSVRSRIYGMIFLLFMVVDGPGVLIGMWSDLARVFSPLYLLQSPLHSV